MVRAAVQVSDLDSSKAFYEEVLGLTEVYSEGAAEGGNMYALIGMPETTTIRFCILKQPEYSSYGMVGLFEASNPAPAKIEEPRQGSYIGELCMVFYCSNLDEIMRRLQAHSHSVLCEPLSLKLRGFVKQREMTLRGPDGEKINLIEWDPDLAAGKSSSQQVQKPEKWQGEPE